MREGLVWREEGLFYYKNDKRYHAGIVKDGDKFYYIGRGGRAVKGSHVVHGEMTNGLVKHGTYIFGEDYAMVEGSYIPPKKATKTKKKKKRKRVKQEFVKSTKPRKLKVKELIMMFSCIAATFAVVAVVVVLLRKPAPSVTTPPVQSPEQTEKTVQITLPADGEVVALCSDAVVDWQNGNITLSSAVREGEPYRAFTVAYRLVNKDGVFRIGERPDLSDAKAYVLAVSETELTIDNLKTDTTYYYQAIVGDEVQTGSFKTAAGTRFIYFPGVQNTRDIGGYCTLDGKTVKQGMIIRGTELDGLVEPQYFLKSNAASIVEPFGFVYDMDLRDAGVFTGQYISRLGDTVEHRFYNAPMYGGIFNKAYKPYLKDIFSSLADPSRYPMYMHCTHGADRTGTVVYLLQGVLGLSDEDMKREYRLTAFMSPGYASADNLEAIDNGLQAYDGDTLQDKIVTFLTQEIGVTQEEIASIRSILLED